MQIQDLPDIEIYIYIIYIIVMGWICGFFTVDPIQRTFSEDYSSIWAVFIQNFKVSLLASADGLFLYQ